VAASANGLRLGHHAPGGLGILKDRKTNHVLTLTEAALEQNAVLAGLSRPMSEDVLKNGKLIELETPQQIDEAGRPIQEVYFPIDAVLSVVTQIARRRLDRGWYGEARGSIGDSAAARFNDLGQPKLLPSSWPRRRG
jgi:hypothetical protein